MQIVEKRSAKLCNLHNLADQIAHHLVSIGHFVRFLYAEHIRILNFHAYEPRYACYMALNRCGQPSGESSPCSCIPYGVSRRIALAGIVDSTIGPLVV